MQTIKKLSRANAYLFGGILLGGILLLVGFKGGLEFGRHRYLKQEFRQLTTDSIPQGTSDYYTQGLSGEEMVLDKLAKYPQGLMIGVWLLFILEIFVLVVAALLVAYGSVVVARSVRQRHSEWREGRKAKHKLQVRNHRVVKTKKIAPKKVAAKKVVRKKK